VVELPGDPETGKRRQKWTTVYGHKRDAERILRRLLTQIDNGRWVDPAIITVSEFAIIGFPISMGLWSLRRGGRTSRISEFMWHNGLAGYASASDLKAPHTDVSGYPAGGRGVGLDGWCTLWLYWRPPGCAAAKRSASSGTTLISTAE
jgi:hypothetical protein